MTSVRFLNLDQVLDGSGIRVGIIKSMWNREIVDSLVDACISALEMDSVTDVIVEEVAGAFELPLAASVLARSGKFDAIIAIGCLVKGNTMHFEYISDATVSGLMRVQLDQRIPVINGVLNVLTEGQAWERCGVKNNHGFSFGKTAVHQVLMMRKYTQ